ncbi:MAG TPA: hypothetical protein VL866_20620 [Pyrinomonadaceae bacterium]|nr:hypothetical protein [Pyrinomonadaceae bacterium]
MKLILILAAIAFALGVLQQQPTVDDADLVVTKFNWSRLRRSSNLIHGVENPGSTMNEPVTIPRPERPNEPQELKNRRDMAQRRAEMVVNDINAARSADTSRPDVYVMHIILKNAGENLIKSFVWELQPAVVTPDYEPRQYVCSVKAKPHESKSFEIITPFAPVKVVSASGEKATEKDGKVVINQIEYENHPVWKRKGFKILVPPDTTAGLESGRCLVF